MRVIAARRASRARPHARGQAVGHGAGRPTSSAPRSQPSSRIASSRRFSSKTASPASWPGRSSRPYLIRPSNSPTHPLLLPREVGRGRRTRRPGAVISNCSADGGELPAVQDDPAAALADALAPPVGEARPPAPRCRLPGVPGDVEQALPRRSLVRAGPCVQGGVQRRPPRPRAAVTGPGPAPSATASVTACRPTDVTSSSRSRATWQHSDPAGVVRRRRTPRDVHPVERDVPQRQPVQDGRRLVAHDRRAAEAGQRRPDEERGAAPRVSVGQQRRRRRRRAAAGPARRPGRGGASSSSDQPGGDGVAAQEERGGSGSAASVMRRRCRPATHGGPRATIRGRPTRLWTALSGCCSRSGVLQNPGARGTPRSGGSRRGQALLVGRLGRRRRCGGAGARAGFAGRARRAREPQQRDRAPARGEAPRQPGHHLLGREVSPQPEREHRARPARTRRGGRPSGTGSCLRVLQPLTEQRGPAVRRRPGAVDQGHRACRRGGARRPGRR